MDIIRFEKILVEKWAENDCYNLKILLIIKKKRKQF